MAKKQMAQAKFTTPMGRLSYPYLFEPRVDKDDPDKKKFETSLLIPKKVSLKEFQAVIDGVCVQAFGKDRTKWPKSIKKEPIIKDGNDREDQEGYKGNWLINARTNAKKSTVAIVDRERPPQPILDESEIYAGCWARLLVTVSEYEWNGKRGVTVYLNAVQKMKDGERIAGTTVDLEEAFADVEDNEEESEESDDEESEDDDGGF